MKTRRGMLLLADCDPPLTLSGCLGGRTGVTNQTVSKRPTRPSPFPSGRIAELIIVSRLTMVYPKTRS